MGKRKNKGAENFSCTDLIKFRISKNNFGVKQFNNNYKLMLEDKKVLDNYNFYQSLHKTKTKYV